MTEASGVREILPGIFHWTTVHPRIHIPVSSYLVREARVLLDPLVPEEGLDAIRRIAAPEHVILTNRHHYRHSDRFEAELGCLVWCNAEGLYEFHKGERVRPFRAGDELPGGIRSLPVGAICDDETALLVPLARGEGDGANALAVADGVVRDGDGPLSFVPDFLMGDDPEAVKRGLRAAYARLLDLPFDHLLCAHGEPWVGGAKAALRTFVGA